MKNFDQVKVEGDDIVLYENRCYDYHRREYDDFEVARITTSNGSAMDEVFEYIRNEESKRISNAFKKLLNL